MRSSGVIVVSVVLVAGCRLAADSPPGAAPGGEAGERSITAVSYGGSYARAVVRGYHESFTEATGVQVDLADFQGGLAQVRAQVEAGAVHWDVVDLSVAETVSGCDEGVLELIDPSILPSGPNGELPEDDFLPEMNTECGVGNLLFSSIFAYNREVLTGPPPTRLADFFDLERFPGRRGVRRSPEAILEMALMADGVPKDRLYDVLSTPEGLERVFRKLDTIKDQVVWWDTSAQAPQLLADGEVLMTMAANGRIFNAQVLEGQPFVIVWDGQVLNRGQLAIVAGTPRLDDAMRFVQHAARAESMAGVGRYIAYSPARYSAEALIDRHFETGTEMWPHMPTNPANMKNYLMTDWRWWADHGDEMLERFTAWLAR
ncbi:MAG: ABC transporter substrate-binding protein [Holophagales bacterium]|nr:ABC transporter substrate-binding protein [Holophagales bacterium]